jgi:hypothetical protein
LQFPGWRGRNKPVKENSEYRNQNDDQYPSEFGDCIKILPRQCAGQNHQLDNYPKDRQEYHGFGGKLTALGLQRKDKCDLWSGVDIYFSNSQKKFVLIREIRVFIWV